MFWCENEIGMNFLLCFLAMLIITKKLQLQRLNTFTFSLLSKVFFGFNYVEAHSCFVSKSVKCAFNCFIATGEQLLIAKMSVDVLSWHVDFFTLGFTRKLR